MKIKMLMVLITFFDLVSSSVTFASSNNRYSRARRTKLAGSRGGTGGTNAQKKRKEQNLMEDYSRFLFSSYNKTLQYGQSYNLQDMLKYDVHKYYKEHGSQDELNEQFCFGPYMKLTSNITGTGGEVVDLRAGDGTVCTYIKPNTNYAITLTDATEKQISNAVKKNATPCMTSADKRRVCITRNGQDLQTMHLTTEMYLDTKPHITAITEAINKVKTSCGDFTKSMATINSQLGLGVSLTSGLGMALSGAATAVGYMNYKATNEQDELLADHKDNQQKFLDAIQNSKFKKEGNTDYNTLDLGGDSEDSVKIPELNKHTTQEEPKEPTPTPEAQKMQKHYELCRKLRDIDSNKAYIRYFNITNTEVITYTSKEKTTEIGRVNIDDVKTTFVDLNDINKLDSYLRVAGNCCEEDNTESGKKCTYPEAKKLVMAQTETKLTEAEKDELEKAKLLSLQDKIKKGSETVEELNANHKKSRNMDIATAALSGTSALSSGIGMGISIAAIQSVEKSIIQLKQCKKDINDLRMLNNKYVSLQDEADTEGD